MDVWRIKVERSGLGQRKNAQRVKTQRTQPLPHRRLNYSLLPFVMLYDSSHAHMLRKPCSCWPRNKPTEHGTNMIPDSVCVCVWLVGMQKRPSVYPKTEGSWPAAHTHTHTHTHTEADSQRMDEDSWEAARLLTAVGETATSRSVTVQSAQRTTCWNYSLSTVYPPQWTHSFVKMI